MFSEYLIFLKRIFLLFAFHMCLMYNDGWLIITTPWRPVKYRNKTWISFLGWWESKLPTLTNEPESKWPFPYASSICGLAYRCLKTSCLHLQCLNFWQLSQGPVINFQCPVSVLKSFKKKLNKTRYTHLTISRPFQLFFFFFVWSYFSSLVVA